MRRFRNSDRGVTLVIVAVSLVSLIAFSGLVLDGGNAYSQRRQMQNSADASALAGANALQRYRQNSSVGSKAIFDAAKAAASTNGAKPTTFACDLVRLNVSGQDIGTTPCPQANGVTILPDTYKVRVRVDSDNATRFISIVGIDSFNARGTAAASVQKAVLTTGPFMICGPTATASGDNVPLLVEVGGEWEWNPAAIGQIYNIWGLEIRDDDQAGRCGVHDDSFRGLVNLNDQYQVPGWWPADPGEKGGTQPPSVVGGCTVGKVKDIPVGCEMALPVCVMGNGQTGSNLELYCVRIGRFVTTKSDNNDIEGRFLGAGVATTGGGGGIPDPDDVVVIKLIE